MLEESLKRSSTWRVREQNVRASTHFEAFEIPCLQNALTGLSCIVDLIHVGLRWHSRMLEKNMVTHSLSCTWSLTTETQLNTPPNLSSNLSRIHPYYSILSILAHRHVLSSRIWHIALAMLIGSACLHPAIGSEAQGMATAALDGHEKTRGKVALPMVVATQGQSLPCII